MDLKSKHTENNSTKKAYEAPQLKKLGNVKQLTLKVGSGADTGKPFV